MIKKHLLIYILFWGFLSSAQTETEKEIVGVYQKRQGPDDFTMVVIFPDHRYIVGYFGGMQKGIWKMEGDFVSLTQETEPAFVLYGRKRKSFGEKTTISYNVEASNRVLVNWESTANPSFVPVFNEGANCFSYPYVQNLKQGVQELKLTQLRQDYAGRTQDKSEIFQFKNPEAFNELLLINLSSQYTRGQTQKLLFKEEELFLSPDGDGIAKRALESLTKEDKDFISHFSKNSLFKEELRRGEEFFPYYENPKPEEAQVFYRIFVDKKVTQSSPKAKKTPLFIVECEKH